MKKTVLAIGAHPDDIEIGCGGTLALLGDRGYRLIHVIATAGEQGSLGDPRELADRRTAEAQASAQVLGASEVRFLGLEDGLTHAPRSAKIMLMRLIRELRPEIVFTHARDDRFPDHRVVRELTDGALTGAQGPWYPEAGLAPHRVPTVYGYEVWNPIREPQCVVDVTETFARKTVALECHASQTASVNYLAAITGLARYRAATGMKGDYAEAFEVARREHLP